MNRSMAFMDARMVEARLLKLAIHVARENAQPMEHAVTPAPQEVVAVMRHRFTVQGQPMTIEPPGTLGRRVKC